MSKYSHVIRGPSNSKVLDYTFRRLSSATSQYEVTLEGAGGVVIKVGQVSKVNRSWCCFLYQPARLSGIFSGFHTRLDAAFFMVDHGLIIPEEIGE